MTDFKQAVIELKAKGYSYNQIAKELGISKSKAYRIGIANETGSVKDIVSEQAVSKVFQDVPNRIEKAKDNTKDNAESLKLQVKLRKLELEHEEKMKLLDFEEKEKQRKFELRKTKITSKNEVLKQKIEKFKHQINELEHQNNIAELKPEIENFEEEEYSPQLDILVKDEILEFIKELLETESFYEEDFNDLFVQITNIKSELLDWAVFEDIRTKDVFEYRLINDIEKVIKYHYNNFDTLRTFFGSTIELNFNENLKSEIYNYFNNNKEE